MRGDDRIRTGGEGVADPCLTTWLCRRTMNIIRHMKKNCKHFLKKIKKFLR